MVVSAEDLQARGVPPAEAARLVARINNALEYATIAERWTTLCKEVLTPGLPFPVHQLLRERVFASWDATAGPAPLWWPSPQTMRESNIGHVLHERGLPDYAALHRLSIDDPESFWRFTIERLGLRFRTPPERMLADTHPPRHRAWLPGARFNIVESCFGAAPSDVALRFARTPHEIHTYTHAELRALVDRVSIALRRDGFVPGDAIAIVMPLRLESIAAYLGIIQAGCVAVSIPESFAPPEIRRRLDIAGAKAILTTPHIHRAGKCIGLYEKVAQASEIPAIVFDDPAEGAAPVSRRRQDIAWDNFLAPPAPFEAHVARAGDPINILFSSGTTGDPKAIPWTQATPIKCASDGFYHHDIRPGDVTCWPTSLGWMMGPWLIFATLINRGTIAIFDDVPHDRAFGAFVSDARVNMLGVVPSLVRAWRASECMKGLDWSTIRAFSSTGECSNADDMHYLMHLAGYRPIIEYCGGTEIGGGYITSSVIQPNVPSAFAGPAIGNALTIRPDDEASATGELFLIPPAMGLSSSLLNADHEAVYFRDTPIGPDGQPLRRHGDQMEALPGGYYRAHGRADDTMNLGGIKVSSAEIERVVAALPGVSDVAAIAVAPPGGGPSQLVIYLVTGSDDARDGDWLALIQQAIRRELNPLFRVSDVRCVERLPRTASNKVLRRQLRAEYESSHRGTVTA